MNMEALVEYYDELYPCTQEQIDFFCKQLPLSNIASKILRVGCGTGFLETKLSKLGYDVTGIDTNKVFLKSASLRFKTSNMSLHFFQMNSLEMGKYLGKKFYNLISCLNDRLIFLENENNLDLFFKNCKELLTENGKIILQLSNYKKFDDGNKIILPVRESIRAKSTYTIARLKNELFYTHDLFNSSAKKINIVENQKVFVPTVQTIEKYSKKAGFNKIQLFSDYNETPFTENSDRIIFVIS